MTMGIASASFTICVRNEDPHILLGDFLSYFSSKFLQPKSLEIRLPGRRMEKVKGSIDEGIFYGKDSLPATLPGEKFFEGTEFTTLERPDEWLSLPRDIPSILERFREFSDESAQLWRSNQAMDDDVFWTCWGLCRVSNDTPQTEYFLRQQLISAECLEPILRVTSHISRYPRQEFILRFFTRSFVWSQYTSRFNVELEEWIPKPQWKHERKNAAMFAEAIRGFLNRHTSIEVEWCHDQEHSPDLRGFVPQELEVRLGPPQTPRNVKDLAK